MNETPFAEQSLDIQHDPDPAQEQPTARRIPHLGHAILYFALNLFCISGCQLIALFLIHAPSPDAALQHKLTMAAAQVSAYIIVFIISFFLFRTIWKRSFAEGISFNLRGMRVNWWKLLLIAAALAALAQAASLLATKFFPTPDKNYLADLFNTTRRAWTTIALVSVIPPIAEEIAFRGFLLPALATAYDWLSLERSPQGIARWEQTVSHTRAGWAFAVFFSSVAFAALHGAEYDWAAGSMAVLFVVSVVLSLVRIRTRSVAASTLVHIAYNALPLTYIIVVTGGLRHLDKLN